MNEPTEYPSMLELLLLAYHDLGHGWIAPLDLVSTLNKRPTLLNRIPPDEMEHTWRAIVATLLTVEGVPEDLACNLALLHPGWRTRMLVRRQPPAPVHA